MLAERAAAIGTATNNVAEYRGLIAGLEAAREIAPNAEINVRMDSKLVVEQMSGRWKVKHEGMRALAREAAQLVAGFPSVTFTWIPRAQNSAADALANAAMDAGGQGRTWSPSDTALPEPRHRVPARASLRRLEPAARLGVGATVGCADDDRAAASRPDPVVHRARFQRTGQRSGAHRERPRASRAGRRAAGGRRSSTPSSAARCGARWKPLGSSPRGREIVVDDGFRETDFGDWEALTFAEVHRRSPEELAAWLADPNVAPPGGESFVDADKRVGAALASLTERYPASRLLVVSHVTPIKLLVRRALEAPMSALYRMHLELCSLSTVDWYADGPAVVRSLNA